MIYLHFARMLKQLDMHPFRFHDLRHYYASILLAIGIPDKYAQYRMGHSSDNMLKNVYQHLFEAKKDKVNAQIDEYVGGFLGKVDLKVDPNF